MIERRRRFFVGALVVAGFKVAGRRWNDLFGLTAECNSAGRTDYKSVFRLHLQEGAHSINNFIKWSGPSGVSGLLTP